MEYNLQIGFGPGGCGYSSNQKPQNVHGRILSALLRRYNKYIVRPQSEKKYVDAIRKQMIVFGLGPAGTGKTYLAMAMAITAFKNNEVERIILTRPAIEAGEKLGFLPGDLQSKVDPYLRPLYEKRFLNRSMPVAIFASIVRRIVL